MNQLNIQQPKKSSGGFLRNRMEPLLEGSGVQINGPNAWDIQVKNPSFFRRVLVGGSMGLGESYMDGWWECEQIDELINRLMRSNSHQKSLVLSYLISWAQAKFRNLQKRSRAFQVGEQHYDLGNDLYEAMLDSRMVYTCGYWARADNLEDAQRDKLDLVCRKLQLKPGMRVLDIGCGWGSFAKFAAQQYGVEVVGVTVSKEQVELGMQRCKDLPVELRLMDYRDVNEKFDAIASLGMFEHVGNKNYGVYMKTVKRNLKKNARFLLHTIGKFNSIAGVDPWIGKYIFPNGQIPSLKNISAVLERKMIIEDMHNFGPDYDRTLLSWFKNFDQAWPELKKKYPERFYRMWKFYLLICAGAFRARKLHLWQFVIANGYPQQAYRRPE